MAANIASNAASPSISSSSCWPDHAGQRGVFGAGLWHAEIFAAHIGVHQSLAMRPVQGDIAGEVAATQIEIGHQGDVGQQRQP
jgi:hypothetical protein